MNLVPILLIFVCLFLVVLFLVRGIAALFSSKILEQRQKNPVIRSIWVCLAFVVFLMYIGVLFPEAWPPSFVDRYTQRQTVAERVQSAGGWESVRQGCEVLVANNPDGLSLMPSRTNVRVHPNPNEPNRFYVTNQNNGQIPPAVAALMPMEIRFNSSNLLKEYKDEPQVVVVRIRIFGMHATGGHSTPYYGLEVPCGIGAENYVPQASQGGVSGNSHRSFRKIANRVFEIF